jgi:hypothetical protein
MFRTLPRPPGPVGGAAVSRCSAPTPHQDTGTNLPISTSFALMPAVVVQKAVAAQR